MSASAPGPHLARKSRPGRTPIGPPGEFILNRRLALAMSEAAPAPARACEPAEAADSADPRAALKAHLYAMANNAFELQAPAAPRVPQVQDDVEGAGRPAVLLAEGKQGDAG